jgi:lipopolysaccharide export system permease protein
MLFFLGAILVFSVLYFAVDLMNTYMSYPEAEMGSVVHFHLAGLGEIIYRMLPVAGLLGAIFTMVSLRRSGELIALYSFGWSLNRILAPLFLWLIFLGGVNLFIADKVLPSLTRTKNYIFSHKLQKKPHLYSAVKTDRIWYRSQGVIFNLKTLNPRENRGQGLTLYYINSDWKLEQKISAQEVEFLKDQWRLKNGTIALMAEDSSFPLVTEFKEKIVNMIEGADDLAATANTSDILSLGELARFIEKNKEGGLDTVRYEVDYHVKFAFALSPILMAMVALPFTLGAVRTANYLASLGSCLAVIFVYWAALSSAQSLGYFGHLPPWLAAWGPNILMLNVGVWLFYWKRQ